MQSAEQSRVSLTSNLTRKGQVTIPIAIRRQLGLKRGDKVAFVQDGEQVTLKPAQSVTERTAGSLGQYRKVPAATAQQEPDAFAKAVAEEVAEDHGG